MTTPAVHQQPTEVIPFAWYVGCVNLFLKRTSPFTSRVSLFVVFFDPVDDHGSPVIFRSVSVRPTHLFDPSFRP